MDVIFEKFGLFDFLGIMGPGIMSTSFLVFCYWLLTDDILFCDSNSTVGVIIVFLILSYMYGIILHEIGKIIIDHIKMFDPEKKKNQLCADNCAKNSLKMEKEFINHIKRIRLFVRLNEFNHTLNLLKYTAPNRKIDAYHSIYGQARGMVISFFFNIAFILLVCHELPDRISFTNIRYISYIVIFDCIMIIVFLMRTYRYFLSWIRNVYYQFYYVTEKSSQNVDGMASFSNN